MKENDLHLFYFLTNPTRYMTNIRLACFHALLDFRERYAPWNGVIFVPSGVIIRDIGSASESQKIEMCVCVSFIRTTMKVQLDTEIAIQI